MKKNVKFKGQLKLYMQWPMFLILLLLAMNAAMYALDIKAGILMSIFVCIYTAIVVVLYYYNKQILINELINFATGYGQIQKKLLQELEIPYTLLDENGKVVWMNTAFEDVVGKTKDYKKSITNLFPALTKDKFPVTEEASCIHVTVDNADYRVEMRRIMMEYITESVNILNSGEYEGYFIAVYLFDETELNRYIKANKEQQLVAGLISIDNYDEVIEGVEEVRSSLLVALIDRKINKYISGIDGIVKKLEKDKYFVVMKQMCLEQLEAKKFELLDDVKTVNIGNDIPITLSIGLGAGGSTYAQNYEYARNAIDLALGRGGDQAIVKRKDNIVYYGGKSKQVEKNTRVKARVKAQALRELIENKDKVLVMGHKIGDVDSFGAAIGIYRAAKTLNKPTHVVINEITTSVRKMIDGFIDNPDYEEDMFVNSSQAKEIVDNNTLLVVVDVNRPSYTECPELLQMCKTIVVLDHHRQTTEIIENAVLSYVEEKSYWECSHGILELFSKENVYLSDYLESLRRPIMVGVLNYGKNGFHTIAKRNTYEPVNLSYRIKCVKVQENKDGECTRLQIKDDEVFNMHCDDRDISVLDIRDYYDLHTKDFKKGACESDMLFSFLSNIHTILEVTEVSLDVSNAIVFRMKDDIYAGLLEKINFKVTYDTSSLLKDYSHKGSVELDEVKYTTSLLDIRAYEDHAMIIGNPKILQRKLPNTSRGFLVPLLCHVAANINETCGLHYDDVGLLGIPTKACRGIAVNKLLKCGLPLKGLQNNFLTFFGGPHMYLGETVNGVRTPLKIDQNLWRQ